LAVKPSKKLPKDVNLYDLPITWSTECKNLTFHILEPSFGIGLQFDTSPCVALRALRI